MNLPIGRMNVVLGTYDDLYDMYEEQKKKEVESKEYHQAQCWHEWKKYVGYTESYEFCTRCDLKRELPNE